MYWASVLAKLMFIFEKENYFQEIFQITALHLSVVWESTQHLTAQSLYGTVLNALLTIKS